MSIIKCNSCKKDIEQGNRICSYCGSIIDAEFVKETNTEKQNKEKIKKLEENITKSIEEEKIREKEERIRKEKNDNGNVMAIISFILFLTSYVPYVYYVIIEPFFISKGQNVGWHIVAAMLSIVFLPVILVSIPLGAISIEKLKKYSENNKITTFRKILNILIKVQLFLTILLLLVVVLFIIYFVFLLLLYSIV